MSAKDKSCHAASEETITINLSATEACRSAEPGISEILFKEPAALCIPVATVGNEITGRSRLEDDLPGQEDERSVTRGPKPF
jgi:hypothetical protein